MAIPRTPSVPAAISSQGTLRLQHILVACDLLSDRHVAQIAATADGWGVVRRISNDAPASEMQRELAWASIVIGWARADLLVKSQVRLYLCASAGLDGYVGAGLEAKPDFRICSAGSTMSVPIAEHLLMLMLALTRDLPVIIRHQGMRRWERRWHAGELNGTTVCIVGLGESGTELARRCQLLGLRVVGVRRDARHGHPNVDVVYPVARLLEAVREADHVVAVVPGGSHTRHLFSASVFAAMKPGARFYSASRGSVVDEPALIAGLRSGQIGGAGLDVFAEEPLPASSPLWEFDNVIVSPHSAGLSVRLGDRLSAHFCRNLERFQKNEPLCNEVDLSRYAIPLP